MSLPNSVLFGLFTGNKSDNNYYDELHDIFNTNGYEINTIETVNKYLSWCLLPKKKIPNVIITDIDIYSPGVKESLHQFKNTKVLLVADSIKNSDLQDLGNVRVYNSYEELHNSVVIRFSSTVATNPKVDEAPEGASNTEGLGSTNKSIDEFDDSNEMPLSFDVNADPDEIIKDVNDYSIWNQPEHNTVECIKEENTTIQNDVPLQVAATESMLQEEEEIFLNRSKEIRKQWSKSLKWKSHRTIGVWSPLHRTGVTSFSFNYGFYLASRGIKSAVLEGLTDNYTMKNWLTRYTPEPDNWSSLAKAIHSDRLPEQTLWEYGDVRFFPLDKGDTGFDWNANSLRYLIQTTNDIKATLIDLPTGEMNSYTTDSLAYMDELWIIVDDAIQETIAWKKYIALIKEQVDIPFKLIFNKEYKFSQSKRLAAELELPLIACLPSLHEETMRNYYENNPLYFNIEVAELLDEPFEELTSYLFKDSPDIPEKRGPKLNMYLNITKRIEKLFK